MFSVMYYYFLITAALLASVPGSLSKKVETGYSSGYLADCPGITKPAIISKKTVKHLSMAVLKFGGELTARRTKYNYWQMDKLVKDPDFDLSKKTMLFVAGYMDSPSFPPAPIIGQHYKDLGYNVLLLDTNYFTTMEYPVAARFVKAVGLRAAEMLVNLTRLGVDPKRLEMVGLSLGGQTGGFVGKHYYNLTGVKLSRFTALDPSGPCFRNLGPEGRVDSSDADFVDIIFTNMDAYGMAAPVGHVNFYINGGEYQPGDFLWMFCNIFCSHARSFTLWIAALENPDKFIGMQCDSVQQARDKECFDRKPKVTNVVGLNTDRSKPGIYYVATYNSFPFYMADRGLKKENEFYETHLSALNTKALMKM